MKKSLLPIIYLLIINQLSFSQSTTILPNRLSAPNVPSLGICDNTSKGSTVFYTTDNKMYYCNGTNWQEMTGGGFTLPYSATQASGNAPLLYLKNTAGTGMYAESTTGTGIVGQSGSSYGVYGISDSNFGGFFTSATGNALGVLGKMNINNTSGSKGGVLSINSAGNPSWQDPVAFCVKGNNGGSLSMPTNTYYKIPFPTEEYDLGNNYNIATSTFTAPVSGIYHFEGFYNWLNGTVTITPYDIVLSVNNNIVQDVSYNSAISVHNPATISIDVLLNVNDTVSLKAYIFGGLNDSRLISSSTSDLRFSGRLVIRQ